YDPYIGMYYLQSRYYNPAYGRFLNVDDTDILEASQGTTHGANLFAYCDNNPVNYVDYTGYVPLPLAVIVVLIIVASGSWGLVSIYKFIQEYQQSQQDAISNIMKGKRQITIIGRIIYAKRK
ncbi:MAG: hypothetical protein IJO44_06685, partial [Clostridia bacterium]|nr:hypothetical protein [Clostridia bacterium]